MRWLLIVLVLAAVVAPVHAARAYSDKKQERLNAAHATEIAAAQTAGEAWLKLLDAEKYGECWKAASGIFQANVPEEAWERRMNAVRKPLDPMLTRTLNTAEYKTELAGLPRGVYVALVLETVFSTAAQGRLETLVMVMENGQWKMVGYAAP